MERPKRAADGGLNYHILNRANASESARGKEKRFLTPFLGPWERSKHAMCNMWHEWDGMQDVVAEEQAKEAR